MRDRNHSATPPSSVKLILLISLTCRAPGFYAPSLFCPLAFLLASFSVVAPDFKFSESAASDGSPGALVLTIQLPAVSSKWLCGGFPSRQSINACSPRHVHRYIFHVSGCTPLLGFTHHCSLL